MPTPNPTTRRRFSNVFAGSSLTGAINTTATSIPVASTAGLTQFPTLVTLERGTAFQEIVLVTGVTGASLELTTSANRAQDNTTAMSHGIGATVTHDLVARDADEANAHSSSSTEVHGVAASVVGTTDTQTLTNKTLTTPIIGSFASANHAHTAGAGGGILPQSSVSGLVTDLAAKSLSTHAHAVPAHNEQAASQSQTSSSYLTWGSALAFTVPASGRCLFTICVDISNPSGGGYGRVSMDVGISGSPESMYAASDLHSVLSTGEGLTSVSKVMSISGLTPGAATCILNTRANGTTNCTFYNGTITIQDF